MAPGRLLRFGPFELDPDTLELRRDGSLVPLEPLPARMLVRLAEHPGALVTRRELLDLGWPGCAEPSTHALNTSMYQVRRALRADVPHGVALETLRGRGYRLRVPALAHEAGAAPRRRRGPPWAWTVAVPGLAALAWLLVHVPSAPAPPEDAKRMVVEARYVAEEAQDPARARRLLDSARVLHPGVALLEAEWADVSARLGDDEAASLAAQSALRLDPHVATAHRAMALLAMLRGEWRTVDTELARARALDPRDTRTLSLLALRRTIEGRFDEAETVMRESARLDPLSGTHRYDAGLLRLLAGRFDAAARTCQEGLVVDPQSIWATDCLFDAFVLSGRLDEAARAGRDLLHLYQADPPPDSSSAAAVVAHVQAWRLQAWQHAVRRGAYPLGLALAYADEGDGDAAIRSLWDAAAQPRLGLLTVGVDPRFAALRGNADFRRLLTRLNLDRDARPDGSGP